MATFTMQQIADYVGGIILCGDGQATIDKFSTNSKTGDEHTLFVPVVGERFDAHEFIKDAFINGIRCTFTKRDEIVPDTEGMTYLKVDEPVAALQRLGAAYRMQFTTPIVGITGSVGKTTTKEMIAAALETKKCVLKTEGNMNSQVGLPQMMTRLNKEHDIAVIEMGMSQFGEMARLSDVAKPTTAVMTNIGVSHIGQLKTKENIRLEKANICNYFSKDSVLLVNGDDELLYELYEAFTEKHLTDKEKTQLVNKLNLSETTRDKLLHATIETYGTNPNCTVYADSIETDGTRTTFLYHYKNEAKEEFAEPIMLSVLGNHNILNALAALRIASLFGIKPSEAKIGLLNYEPIAMRGGIIKVNQLTIIDDTYNASPDSMKGAVNILLDLPKENRKIIVFADVLELGELSKECHAQVGSYIAKMSKTSGTQSVDILVTIGCEAKYIADELKALRNDIIVSSYSNKEEAIEYLESILKPNDTILVKGSRGMQLEKTVEQLKKVTMRG